MARLHMIDELNIGRGPLAQLEYDGDALFGPAMKVQRYRMGNGLRVLVLVDRNAPVVSYHTWVRVGSRDEKPGKTGIAHLFEHLMFNETSHLAAGEFDRILEENGAESNAGTWVDWTYYHESLPAPKVGLAIKLEADRLANLVLRDKQVGSEKEVVANERRYRVDDDVEGSINELLYKTAFTTHPYHWPTIGWMEDIQGFTTQDCESFYRTYYAPNNVTVVVVGDVQPHEVLRLIQDHYGSLQPSKIPERKLPKEPPQDAERRLEVKKPTATEKVMIGWKAPPVGDADHVALTIMNEILFGGRSSRVYRALIKQQEIASDIRGWLATFADPGVYEVWLTAREAHTAEELERSLATELQAIKTKEPTAEELEKAKSRLELAFLQGLETASGKAEQIGFYDTVLHDPGAGFARLEAYRAVTGADVLRVAKKYLVDAQRTVIRVFPDGTAGSADGDDGDEGGDDGEADEAIAHKPEKKSPVAGKGAIR
ncbi:MAG: insulinase family protein [Deltaproteobacteria bacterium]|nr:insulinase family protein [Deltaproteobacteria bacterium]